MTVVTVVMGCSHIITSEMRAESVSCASTVRVGQARTGLNLLLIRAVRDCGGWRRPSQHHLAPAPASRTTPRPPTPAPAPAPPDTWPPPATLSWRRTSRSSGLSSECAGGEVERTQTGCSVLSTSEGGCSVVPSHSLPPPSLATTYPLLTPHHSESSFYLNFNLSRITK